MSKFNPDSALVVLSGGQDSTTCLYWAKQRYGTVHALTFYYGQRHHIEVLSAQRIADIAKVATHEFVSLKGDCEITEGVQRTRDSVFLRGTSPLVNQSEKLEQYENWQSLPGGLEKTFVPGRNALFLVLAANRAYCLGTPNIVTGICQEDFGGYPDCREEFRAAMQNALIAGLDFHLEIHAPLMFLSKADSVRLARTLPGCWDALAHTHTAYDGAYPPTGHDHATLLRAKGFEEANEPDPLVVRAWREGLMPLPTTHNYDTVRPHDNEHQG